MVSIVIPTYNGAGYLPELMAVISRSPLETEVIIIDSSSTDNTVVLAREHGARVIEISQNTFNHGGTRNLGAMEAVGDILVFLTQDALPVDEGAVGQLVRPLYDNPKVGASYGRQLPRHDANAFAAHLREFNYPPESMTKSLADAPRLGMKTAFISNSFAAYRKAVLEEIGWFKDGLMMCEDIHAGARIIKGGHSIAYVAEACVYHSHNYSVLKETRRYHKVGAFYKSQPWIVEEFGAINGEGMRFVLSELDFLTKRRMYHLLPLSLCRNFIKYLGFRSGLVV